MNPGLSRHNKKNYQISSALALIDNFDNMPSMLYI